MSINLEWTEIALRLALTVVAGALLGIDRTLRGKPVGLRTTMLVCLSASVAMIQTNLLLSASGKEPQSFAVMDVMRLPLGILTGMGFIGAGAIVRKGKMVQGITTAATLWLTTVIGLCLGGGQIGLGLSALVLGVLVLEGLQAIEGAVQRERRASLVVRIGAGGPSESDVRAHVVARGYQITLWQVDFRVAGISHRWTVRCEMRGRTDLNESGTSSLLDQLTHLPGVLAVRWRE